jgi:hypothetical protein
MLELIMAYPADTLIETAITNIELALVENTTVVGSREAVGKWRELLKFIESLVSDGATGYDSLATKMTDADWVAQDLFNGPND